MEHAVILMTKIVDLYHPTGVFISKNVTEISGRTRAVFEPPKVFFVDEGEEEAKYASFT